MEDLIKAWRIVANTQTLSLADRIKVDVAIGALTGKGSERALEMFVVINQVRGMNAHGIGGPNREIEEVLAKAIGDDDHSFFESALKNQETQDMDDYIAEKQQGFAPDVVHTCPADDQAYSEGE